MQFSVGLQYKGWWLMCLQVLFVCATDPLPTLLMFRRMGSIGVWSPERILLIYVIALTSFGIAESFCRGFDYFPWKMLQTGDFDRLLLRPRNLAVQVAGSVFHIHRLSRVAAGFGMIVWLMNRLGIALTPLNLAVLAQAIVGGALMYCGVFVLSSGVAFFTVKALDWIYILTNASYQVTRVPTDYMPRLMHRVFTFFLPILLISYYPASVACAWGEPTWTGFLALPAGLLFLVLSLLVWKIGVRHYTSTGS
jgi:ABC-2 type transport system permease protein